MSILRTIFATLITSVTLMMCTQNAPAQQYQGEVVGTISGATHKYHGEFYDDLWGPGAFVGIHYAPLSVLNLEARFGLGEIRWKVTPTGLAAFPDYFGQGAEIGDPYPGTLTTIETENESRITTYDLLVNYVIVQGIDAVPFITVGVGLLNFSPSNGNEHSALPNNIAGIYDTDVFSIPVGGGVRIPFSDRAGIVFRAEHRFVFSEYLDDLNDNGMNDALSTLSIGLTYRFTEPSPEVCWESFVCDCCQETWTVPCGEPHLCPDCHGTVLCDDCGCCCCCCCCSPGGGGSGGGGGGGNGGGGSGGGGNGGGGEPVDVGPPPPEPGEPREKFSKDIRFKLNTDEFDFSFPQTQANLDQLLDYMQSAPDGHEIVIEGHASGEGPPERNKVLSDIRPKKIKEWLVQKGVPPNKIRGTVGYGSSVPKVKEPTPEEMASMSPEEIEKIRAQNRRIEIYVLKDAYEKRADDEKQQYLEEKARWEEEKAQADETNKQLQADDAKGS